MIMIKRALLLLLIMHFIVAPGFASEMSEMQTMERQQQEQELMRNEDHMHEAGGAGPGMPGTSAINGDRVENLHIDHSDGSSQQGKNLRQSPKTQPKETRMDSDGIYMGTFVDGKLHGHGSFTSADGSTTYLGQWSVSNEARPLHTLYISNMYIYTATNAKLTEATFARTRRCSPARARWAGKTERGRDKEHILITRMEVATTETGESREVLSFAFSTCAL